MSLRIERLEFRNFRNYEHFTLEAIEPVTVFVGDNAVGKTNIIEGIQLLTSLRSFRTARAEHLKRDGIHGCLISARITDATRQLDVQMSIEGARKKYSLNGKPKKAIDMRGILPSVIFTPDDLELVKDTHKVRRNELDMFGEQLSSNHGLIKNDYEKVLKHKNKLLKDEANSLLIENINDLLVTCGAQLSCYRAALVRKMLPFLQDIYREISSGREKLDMKYIPSWVREDQRQKLCESDDQTMEFSRDEARNEMYQALVARHQRERDSHRCLVGPHLDQLIFTLDGKEASLFGSQGQQRCVVLAMKLSELLLFQDILQQKPVLLLDDVMSELDEARRTHLISFIQKDMQVFITTTNMGYFQHSLLPSINEIRLPLETAR